MRPRPCQLFVLVLAAILFGRVEPIEADSPGTPPPIGLVRFDEDYSYLRNAGSNQLRALSPWTSLKYIPLNKAGDLYLTLGTEVRLRYERYDNNLWGQGPQDSDGYLWARFLPLADLHLGEHVRVFGQLISAFAFGLDVPKSPIDENRLDVLQSFIDLRLPLAQNDQAALTLRFGRQLLSYGAGRLIDTKYGVNVLQTFDAGKAFIETDRWRLDGFYAQAAAKFPGVFDDRVSGRQSLWAFYGTLHPRATPVGLDLYYIGYLNREADFGRGTGRELRHTIGSRVFGETRGWDWNFEFAYQFGEFESGRALGNISAWALFSDTGYTFKELSLRPRFALRADVTSGDHNPNDADVQTFNPLFTKGKYCGELAPVGPANLIRVNPYAQLQLTDNLQLTGNLAFYWRESTHDGIYGLGNMQLLRAGEGSRSRYVGTQAELILEYQVNRNLSLQTSYSLFTAGSFIKDTGPHDPIHFIC